MTDHQRPTDAVVVELVARVIHDARYRADHPVALIHSYDEEDAAGRNILQRLARAAIAALASGGDAAETSARIDRAQYPEIVQAVRWSDESNGTNHFQPGVGFIVDDPDGLSIPARWLPHLPTIEQALAGLDHANPHPLDVDAIAHRGEADAPPTVYETAAYCFVCGEQTPMMAMAHSSAELWIAHRFLNEYFEGWEFDPGAGYASGGDAAELAAAEMRERCAKVADAQWGTYHEPDPWDYGAQDASVAIAAAIKALPLAKQAPQS